MFCQYSLLRAVGRAASQENGQCTELKDGLFAIIESFSISSITSPQLSWLASSHGLFHFFILYTRACEDNEYSYDGSYDRPDGYYDDYYLEQAQKYATTLEGLYRTAKTTILEFHGGTVLAVNLEPVAPDSAELVFVILSITSFSAADINTDTTLDSTTSNRELRVEFNSDVYSSLQPGSSATIEIHNIRPAGESVLIEVREPSALFNEGGTFESISVDGSLRAYRRE